MTFKSDTLVIFARIKKEKKAHVKPKSGPNTYGLHVQMHRKVLWDNSLSVAYHYILLTCKSVTNIIK